MADPNIERQALALFEKLLDVPEAERDAWIEQKTADNPELRTRLHSIRKADKMEALRTGGFDAFAEDDVEDMPQRVGAYRITERIGKGGMGTVWRGERSGDFEHVAAIKIIKPGLFSDALVERFQRERQTLASLTHPNIAQLFDGGETESGSPYIVMEYVDGLPLLIWAEENEADIETRVRLFTNICRAVAFAHRNLIIHRDITPSNVLVTRDGTVKLIDFGIAKLASDTEESGEGEVAAESNSIASLTLTPGYSAPERRISSKVTTSADIYSLGRLLDKLIVPVPPDLELEAIVATATLHNAADRYPTAETLRDDVTNWLKGLPVDAIQGGRRYLARKFVTRHRAAVISTIGAFALLTAALAAALVSNARATAAQEQAQARFEETRKIAKTLLFDTFDEVSKVPGSILAREKLARTGLEYLDALAADKNAPLDVKLEAGKGYTRLGTVMGGEGSGMFAKIADGNALYGKAERVLKPLYDRYPENPDVRIAYASLLLAKATLNLASNSEYELGGKQALRAQHIIGELGKQSQEAALVFVRAVREEGESYGWLDQPGKSAETLSRTETYIEALPAEKQQDSEMRQAFAANLRALAEPLAILEREEDALAASGEAVAINRELLAAHSNDPQYVRPMATSAWYHAVLLREYGKNREAYDNVQVAVANARILRQRDADDPGSARLYAVMRSLEAQIMGDLGRFAESFAISDEVVAINRQMMRLADNAPGAMRNMASALSTRGGNFYNGKGYAKACAAWREGYDILARLDKSGDLSEYDRNGEMTYLKGYLQKNCENGPARAGMGPKM